MNAMNKRYNICFSKSLLFVWHSMHCIIKTPFTVCMKENANLLFMQQNSDSMYFFGRFFPQKQDLGKDSKRNGLCILNIYRKKSTAIWPIKHLSITPSFDLSI